MLVTETGWFIIALACILILFHSSWLYAAMVFFIPFSATAIVNFGSGDSVSGLQATMFFGVLWIIREVPLLTMVLFKPNKSIILLILFMVVVATSLVMPVIIDGSFQVKSIYLLDQGMTPVTLTSRNITQVLYLAYGVIIAILVSRINLKKYQLRSSVRMYVLSGCFVSLWGLLQWSLYQLDIPYPDFIFNNNLNSAASGFMVEFIEIGVKRISSVVVESSIFAQFILTVFPFIIYSVYYKKPIFSLTIDRAALVLILIVLIACASTTAYLGLVLLPFVFGMVTPQFKIFRPRQIIVGVGVVALVVSAYFLSPPIGNYMDELIFLKPQSYSALERSESVAHAWDYFLEYPILGIGWGTADSHDLFIRLLSATGIVGFMAFILFMSHVLMRLLKALKEYRNAQELDESALTLSAATVSFIILLLLNTFTGFALVFGHFWFILGLVMAAPSVVLNHRRVHLEKSILPKLVQS